MARVGLYRNKEAQVPFEGKGDFLMSFLCHIDTKKGTVTLPSGFSIPIEHSVFHNKTNQERKEIVIRLLKDLHRVMSMEYTPRPVSI